MKVKSDEQTSCPRWPVLLFSIQLEDLISPGDGGPVAPITPCSNVLEIGSPLIGCSVGVSHHIHLQPRQNTRMSLIARVISPNALE